MHMEKDDHLEALGVKNGNGTAKLTQLHHENVADALVWIFMEVGQVSAKVRGGVVSISTKVSTS